MDFNSKGSSIKISFLVIKAVPLEAAPAKFSLAKLPQNILKVNPIVLGFWFFVLAPKIGTDVERKLGLIEPKVSPEQPAFDYGGFNPKPKLFAAFQFPNI